MARLKGSGMMGVVRSMRLPRAIDAWFEERLAGRPELSSSDLLVSLIHGGLRLQDGYMTLHRAQLEQLAEAASAERYYAYRLCLTDTFGVAYVDHLDRWISADTAVD